MLTWLSEVLPEIKLWEFFYSEWGESMQDITMYIRSLTVVSLTFFLLVRRQALIFG